MADSTTVLVIDDDAAMRLIVSLSLRLGGYKVLVAANGEEALALTREHPDIRVIILDVVMAGLSGAELAARLTERLPGVAILFCSGHPASALNRYGIDPGSVNFMQKPCSAPALKQKIDELLATA
jgi:two-component system, cell cycle sensor histidine kinase and response regulator CckA